DLTNLACWSTHAQAKTLLGAAPYYGGTFDGRYVYFVSNLRPLVVRYDPSLAFTDDAAWSSYDASRLARPGDPLYFAGIVFDGRYLYFVPNSPLPEFIRYDTKAPFTRSEGWTRYVPKAELPSYEGGTFDGRYVYFAPYEGTGSGRVA